ncbi:MAG: hypothetical protein C4K49_07920 [Candidatus Thorarchaeota archaeon]|nr:MAG: hypothetical protein C4K49_07920 [Candidatus Thorarchaeota archaeon]
MAISCDQSIDILVTTHMSSDDSERHKRRKLETETDAEEIKEIFGALNDAIPKLITGLIGSFYSPESASKMAEAIGGFYSKLKEQGIPDDLALEMTKKYVSALDFREIMTSVGSEARKKKRIPPEDFDAEEEDTE